MELKTFNAAKWNNDETEIITTTQELRENFPRDHHFCSGYFIMVDDTNSVYIKQGGSKMVRTVPVAYHYSDQHTREALKKMFPNTSVRTFDYPHTSKKMRRLASHLVEFAAQNAQ